MGRPRTGSASRRDGRWVARITLHREPHAPGKRPPRAEVAVTRSDGKPITEAWARAFAARVQQRYDDGLWTPPGRSAPVATLTVGEWCARWIARQTYREAPRDAARLAQWLTGTALAALPLASVTPRDVAAWLDGVRARTTRRGGAPAPRTVRNALDPVARALRAAVFEGLLHADPTAVLPTELRPQSIDAHPERRRHLRLTHDEVRALLTDPGTPADRLTLYALLVYAGLRSGEMAALRWCDLVPDQPLARIVVAEQVHYRTRERETTKTTTVREIPCHPALARVLEGWRRAWPEHYGREPTAADLIVPTRGEHRDRVGPARRQGNVWRELQRDLAGCDLRAHRVHDLRHTFVSLCADSGCAPDVVTRWTHAAGGGSTRALYLVASWSRQCAEMLRLPDLTVRMGGCMGGAGSIVG